MIATANNLKQKIAASLVALAPRNDKNMLSIKNLQVSTEGKDILKGVDLKIRPGEVHAIMGPNGAGKTTLAMAVAGHPSYKVKSQKSHKNSKEFSGQAKVKIDKEDITIAKPEERARHGLFIAFQQPIEVTGVSFLAFLRTAYKALHPKDTIPLFDFKKQVLEALKEVHLDESFMSRYLNEGFSGGEKKRAEVAQLIVLKPKFAILDEIDSGLDVDSLKFVASALKKVAKKQKMGILLITHYQRILHHLKPDYVHVLMDGKIVASDGIALVRRIEKKGYQTLSLRAE